MGFSNLAGQNKARKRFISGAICPACGAEDRIYLLGEGSDTRRQCNSCDFVEQLSDLPEETDSDALSDVAVVKIQMPD